MAKCKLTNILEVTSNIAKWRDIWDSRVLVEHITLYPRETFHLIVFKGIVGSFGGTVSELPATRKRLVVEKNGLMFMTRGVLAEYIWSIINFLLFRVSPVPLGAIFSKFTCYLKTAGHRANGLSLWYIYMEYAWPCVFYGHIAVSALVSKWTVCIKWLSVEWHGLRFWTQ